MSENLSMRKRKKKLFRKCKENSEYFKHILQN